MEAMVPPLLEPLADVWTSGDGGTNAAVGGDMLETER